MRVYSELSAGLLLAVNIKPAQWPNSFTWCLWCRHPIWIHVGVLAAPWSILFPANVFERKWKGGPSAWNLESTRETLKRPQQKLTPSFPQLNLDCYHQLVYIKRGKISIFISYPFKQTNKTGYFPEIGRYIWVRSFWQIMEYFWRLVYQWSTDQLCTGSLPKWQQHLGLGQAETSSLRYYPVFLWGWQGS